MSERQRRAATGALVDARARAASQERIAAAREVIAYEEYILFGERSAGTIVTTADAAVQATHYDETYTVVALRVACARLGLRGDGVRAVLTERLNHRVSH
jgi:hypothetical protein